MTVQDLDFARISHVRRSVPVSPPRFARARAYLSPLAGEVLLLGLLALAASCVLSGCSSTWNEATHVANGARELGHEVAPILKEECTDQGRAALQLPENERGAKLLELERKGCSKLSNGYKAVRLSHAALHATIVAARAGKCQGVSVAAKGCNVEGASLAVGAAALQVSDALTQVAK